MAFVTEPAFHPGQDDHENPNEPIFDVGDAAQPSSVYNRSKPLKRRPKAASKYTEPRIDYAEDISRRMAAGRPKQTVVRDASPFMAAKEHEVEHADGPIALERDVFITGAADRTDSEMSRGRRPKTTDATAGNGSFTTRPRSLTKVEMSTFLQQQREAARRVSNTPFDKRLKLFNELIDAEVLERESLEEEESISYDFHFGIFLALRKVHFKKLEADRRDQRIKEQEEEKKRREEQKRHEEEVERQRQKELAALAALKEQEEQQKREAERRKKRQKEQQEKEEAEKRNAAARMRRRSTNVDEISELASQDAKTRQRIDNDSQRVREENREVIPADGKDVRMVADSKHKRGPRHEMFQWDEKLSAIPVPQIAPCAGKVKVEYMSEDAKQKKAAERTKQYQAELKAVKKIRLAMKDKAEELRRAMVRAGEVFDSGIEDELVLQECLRTGVKYIDTTFPPEFQSISGNDDAPTESEKISRSWCRPEAYLAPENPPELFLGTIEPDDINQGQLGDCWFLCSVAALAEFPNKVADTFDHPDVEATRATRESKMRVELRKGGAFRATINKHGWWRTYVMDTYLPGLQKPVFAHNKTEANELWVAFLEKAFARAHGSYSKIVAGDPVKALTDLTGFPTRSFTEGMSDPDASVRLAMHDQLCKYDAQGYLMTVYTPGSSEDDRSLNHASMGLVTGHAYSMLQAIRMTESGKEYRLVQIRNPWGNAKEWTGAWSDSAPEWDSVPNIEAKYHPKADRDKKDDGKFWMSWDDCCKWFQGGGACMLKHGWYDHRVKGEFSGGVASVALEIEVYSSVEVILSVSQTCPRADPNYQTNAFLLTLAKPTSGDSDKYKSWLHGTDDPEHPSESIVYRQARDQALITRLQPQNIHGRPYVLHVKEYHKSATCPYVLGIISDKPAGPNTFSVKFKKLPINRDGSFFLDGPGASSVTCEYQFNDDDGVAVSCRGTEISQH